MLRLAGLVLPLALDTFAVCAAFAAAGVAPEQRRRLGATVVLFEAGMPLVGLGLGRGAAGLVGGGADWMALVCMAGVGVWLVVERDEEPRAGEALRWPALLLLGVAVSVDELALGFSFGLLGVPILWAILLIGAQALVAAQLGFRLGAHAGAAASKAGRAAGALLLAVALALVIGQLN
jgi:putative Mn2+ efflux pump MntP